MALIEAGQAAPDFTLPGSDGQPFTLSGYRGKKVVLFFYPKDMTPTCTQESCDFRDCHSRFAQHNAVVAGISPDSQASHGKFIAKQGLPFVLLSDEDRQVCELYGVWALKKLYGREYMGVERSTFLVDEEGRIAQVWRKVKVKGHATAVLDAVKSL